MRNVEFDIFVGYLGGDGYLLDVCLYLEIKRVIWFGENYLELLVYSNLK